MQRAHSQGMVSVGGESRSDRNIEPSERGLPLRGKGNARYLLVAICMAICEIMLAPLVVSISASFKTPQEAAAIPPTYFTHQVSFDSYQRLWNYQAGLPTYLINSAGTALLTITFCLLLTIPAGYSLARFPV